MARYGTSAYDTFKYGEVPAGTFSVDPFTLRVIGYKEVYLYWRMPVGINGSILRFRLVRNQDGFPDTPEDGVILLDTADPSYLNGTNSFSSAGHNLPTISPDPSFRDGEANLYRPTDPTLAYLGQQLIPGKYVYYSIWLLLSGDNGAWMQAGSVSGLLAEDHSRALAAVSSSDRSMTTHDRVMDLLPRVFTSVTNSPLDTVDTNSDLYNFLSAFSYTLDELFTFADLLLPHHLFTNLSATLLNAKAYEYGFTSENRASSKFQRRLVREAHAINSAKGTAASLKNVVESMTGYPAVITASPNLMLSTQDSTFRKGIGFWRVQGPGTLATDNTTVPPTGEANSLDSGYTGKVVVPSAGTTVRIDNGNDFPITRGIPVAQNTSYSFSLYFQGTVASVVGQITWYDSKANILGSSVAATLTSSAAWTKQTITAVSPAGATYAGVSLAFPTGTFWIDLVQFAVSTATTFSEARGVDVYLTASKFNLIINPSFGNVTYTQGWSITGTPSNKTIGASPLDGPPGLQTGASFLGVTGGVSGNSASTRATDPLKAGYSGKFYTFSIYGKVPVANSAAASQTISLSASDSSKAVTAASGNGTTVTYISSNSYTAGQTVTVTGLTTTTGSSLNLTSVIIATNSSTYFTIANTTVGTASGAQSGSVTSAAVVSSIQAALTTSWQRFQVSVFVPTNYTFATLTSSVFNVANTSADVYLEAAQLEPGILARDYFDGSYVTPGGEWATLPGTGSDNNSISYMYENKAVKIPRLKLEVPRFLPLGTPYTVRTQNKIEFSGFA